MKNARPLRVFVVEDAQIAREHIATLLDAVDGLEVVGYAAEAEDAIARILADRPDAVVADVRLARGTGFDVLRAVRVSAPQIDIYMLTNLSTPPYREHAARLGACDLFDKSFEFQWLRDALQRRALAIRPEAAPRPLALAS